MRLISTLFLLFIASCCFGQMVDTSKVVIINCWGRAKTDTTKKPVTYSCRLKMMEIPTEPLLIVDGVPHNYDSLKMVDPDDIESIDVLKDAVATAIYGHQAAKGVVIITTKSSRVRTFFIKDFTNGKPVSGATVSFISANKNDSLFFAANDSGLVTTNKLTPGVTYSIQVSSVGYKTYQQDFRNASKQYPKDILLTNDIKQCPEVVLTGTQCWTRCRNWGWAKVIREKEIITAKDHLLSIYPNPVSKGAVLTIQWKNVEEAVAELRLVSLDGRTILRQPITNKGTAGQLQLSADSRWASGIYFLQMICEKGRVLASEKIIIQ